MAVWRRTQLTVRDSEVKVSQCDAGLACLGYIHSLRIWEGAGHTNISRHRGMEEGLPAWLTPDGPPRQHREAPSPRQALSGWKRWSISAQASDFILEQPLSCSLLCVLKSVQRIGSKGRRAGGATPKYEETLRARHFKTHHWGLKAWGKQQKQEEVFSGLRCHKSPLLGLSSVKLGGRGWPLVEESSLEADPTPETVAQAVTLPSTSEPDLPKITRSLPDAYTLLPFPY